MNYEYCPIKFILLYMFHTKKTARNNNLNMYADTVKTQVYT